MTAFRLIPSNPSWDFAATGALHMHHHRGDAIDNWPCISTRADGRIARGKGIGADGLEVTHQKNGQYDRDVVDLSMVIASCI
jgi:hypothetical protein